MKPVKPVLHSEMQTFVDQFALLDPPLMSTQTPDEMRAGYELYCAMAPAVDGVSIEPRTIPGHGDDLTIRVSRPAATNGAMPGLVYLHGGGHCVGSAAGYDGPASALAAAGNVVVVSVDYRLAPEHLFPSDVEDAFATVRWVTENAGDLGIDPERVAVGGDSAGGNLAAVAARQARDQGGPPIAAQLLLYPWVDLACDRPSMTANRDGYVLRRADLDHWRHLYTDGDSSLWEHPDASALHAENLSGLPPAVVVTCAFDPLCDQGDEYARRLEAAGVPVRHRRYGDLIHTFIHLGAISPRAGAATEEVARELASVLSPGC